MDRIAVDVTRQVNGAAPELVNRADAAELAGLCHALSDPDRLRLVSVIAAAEDGWICECRLRDQTGVSEEALVRHLAVLRDAGLVKAETREPWEWFALQEDRLDAIKSMLVLSGTCDAELG